MITQEFKALVDRSAMLLITKCDVCGEILARVIHPETLQIDEKADEIDHYNKTGHSSYTAIKHVILYMNPTDKELSIKIGEQQQKDFNEFLERFKKRLSQKE